MRPTKVCHVLEQMLTQSTGTVADLRANAEKCLAETDAAFTRVLV